MKSKQPAIYIFLVFFLSGAFQIHAQNRGYAYTSDIDNFWKAYDSIETIKDTDKQVAIMKAMYTDKGTIGLKQFMAVRKFDAAKLVEVINKYPKFWHSIRPNTLKLKEKLPAIENYIQQLYLLYPDYRKANIYFTISAIRAAGVVEDSLALIGCEIAMGNKFTDVSEFPDKRLENFFKTQSTDNIIPVVIHEYVHTQQKGEGKILLGQSIYEGACDFITELVLKTTLTNSYLVYGRTHEKELKQQFKNEMLSEDLSNWLYNGSTTKTMGDLGYFMGYTICKSYYHHAKDKGKAIKDIITLNYADQTAITEFLKQSKYY